MTPKKQDDSPHEWETMKQAAKRVQLGERTLRRYIAEGKLTAYRAGRAVRLCPEDVDALFTRVEALDD